MALYICHFRREQKDINSNNMKRVKAFGCFNYPSILPNHSIIPFRKESISKNNKDIFAILYILRHRNQYYETYGYFILFYLFDLLYLSHILFISISMPTHKDLLINFGFLPGQADEITKATESYIAQQRKRDLELGSQIHNVIIRGIFQILINLSYILLAVGLTLSIHEGKGLADRLIAYVMSPGRCVFMVVLVLLALYKHARIALIWQQDLVVEIIRASIYICNLIYFGPFISADPVNRTLAVAYWAFLLATILYVVRKALKWYNFLVIDKENYTPWEKMDLNSPLLLFKIASFSGILKKSGTDITPANANQIQPTK